MTTFKLPDLGEGLQEAEVVAWHVGVGDHVVADQPLVSVETEKAVVEIPSPQSGRIAELFAGVGDIVRIGAPLVAFEEQAAADTGTVGARHPPPPQQTQSPEVRGSRPRRRCESWHRS
jgi:pyruvate dehydrogenase E2 component (dihydrolipoamide acetyltransferase)